MHKKAPHKIVWGCFISLYLRPESNRHSLRNTSLSRARLPVPPLRQLLSANGGQKYSFTNNIAKDYLLVLITFTLSMEIKSSQS